MFKTSYPYHFLLLQEANGHNFGLEPNGHSTYPQENTLEVQKASEAALSQAVRIKLCRIKLSFVRIMKCNYTAAYLKISFHALYQSPMPVEDGELSAKASMATLTQYLWSIIYMPHSMKILCLTNLFCWMSLVCYSLYFTDFVGEAVFKGNPVVRILH